MNTKFDSIGQEKLPKIKEKLYYLGLKDPKIKELQIKLIKKGFLDAEATGFFGTKTFTAVKKFQQVNKLNPDGIIGNLTLAKLMEEDSGKDALNGNDNDLNKIETKFKKSFSMNGTYESPKPSVPELTGFIEEMKIGDFKLKNITVDTALKEAICTAFNDNNETREVRIPVNIGSGGVVDNELSVSGDQKTPITGAENFFLTGNSRVKGGIRSTVADNLNEAVIARDGSANLGAAFIGFDAVDKKGTNRGIGFHGHMDNALEPTNGCIRMYNDDILMLYPFMGPDIKVNII